MTDLINNLYNLILAADKNGALELIGKWAKDNSYEEALSELVDPALQKFGVKWASQEDLNLAQGYIAAKVSEEVLKKISEERKDKNEFDLYHGIAVLGNIEDDYHALGRKMVRNFLQSSGWHVYDLGNDVLAQEFVNKAVEVKATIIGVSAMMYTNARNMIKVRKELDNRGLSGKIKFAVGGTIFNMRPELVEEVGADGTAPNAMEAVKLFNRWYKETEANHE